MDLRNLLFSNRGYIPVPFTLAALYWARFHPGLLFAGAVLLIAGENLRIRSIRHAGGATRTRKVGASSLVTTGPYARMRNPLYAANILIYTGFAIASGALFPYLQALTLVWFIFQYSMIVSLEEETLRSLFGREYLDYSKSVPRLFPKVVAPAADAAPTNSFTAALREERSTILGIGLTFCLLLLRFYLSA